MPGGVTHRGPNPKLGTHPRTLTMTEDALRDFSGTARLFPLPNLVLFPHVIQGLHIFEPRYRQMTADALSGDGLIALVTIREGTAEGDEHPPIDPVACLGQIVWHERLPDGRYNLRLRGVSRIRVVEEFNTGDPYRSARVELMADTAPSDLAALARTRRDLAGIVLPRFSDDSSARQQLQELFDGDLPLGPVCDILAYALPLPTEVKRALLADTRVESRAAAISDALRVSAARSERPFPPPFSAN
jgi:Lon protease-like protein